MMQLRVLGVMGELRASFTSNPFVTCVRNLFFPSLTHHGFIKHLSVPGVMLDARDTGMDRLVPTAKIQYVVGSMATTQGI